MNNPLVSIIIPTFNRAHLIGETLDSVLAQTYTNWECIVVDDGSSDNTKEIVQQYIEKDQRYSYLKNDRVKGAQGARNKGVLAANGEYVQFLDSDDFIDYNKILKQICVLTKNPKLEMVFCLSEYFQRENGIVIKNGLLWNQNQESKDYIYDFLMDNPVFHTNEPLWKMTAIKRIGFWDEQLSCWQDWVYHIKALSKKIQYSYIDEVLSFIDDTPKKINSVNGYSEIEKLCSRIEAGVIVKTELLNQESNIKYKKGLCFHFILISKESVRIKNYKLALLCQKYVSDNYIDYKVYISTYILRILLKFFRYQKWLNLILGYQYNISSNSYINTWKKSKIN